MKCLPRTCCFCVDHVEGVKVVGIFYLILGFVICAEQVVVASAVGVLVQLALGLFNVGLIHGAIHRKRALLLSWIFAYSVALISLLAYELFSAIEEKNGLYAIIIAVAGELSRDILHLWR